MIFPAVCALFLAANINLSAGRAVNISNTWMLPEEGFPVFYRHFRDRISWYEADAVCQFHHANLVTADSTSEYDAIRAYLKELDIIDTVWIGLSRTSEKPNFTWTDFRPLTGDGRWQEAVPSTQEPACVAMDPASDFLWKVYPCGGPDVASFICEIPIPSWALGPRGCLLTELPSLTVLYIPEQASLELTSDCGLDGTKRIACKGDADREALLRQLTCTTSNEDFDDKTTKSFVPTAGPADLSTTEEQKTTKTWIWTSNTVDVDFGMPTRHRRETEETPSSTKSTAPLTTSDKPNTYTATTFDTEVTTGNFESSSPMDSTTFKYASGVETSSTAAVVTSSTEDPDHATISSSYPSGGPATVSTTEARAVYHSTSDPTSEYSSAINQGQLFSIIENGTMFDIIELNDTNGEHEPKINSSHRKQLEVTTFKPSVKLSDKNTKIIDNPSKVKISKKDIYKNADPKKANYPSMKSSEKHKLNLTEPNNKTNLSKEVDLFPINTNPNEKLNRTFRKEVPRLYESPPTIRIESNFETSKQDNSREEATEVEDLTDNHEAANPIDPKLHILNNITAKPNETDVELVEHNKENVTSENIQAELPIAEDFFNTTETEEAITELGTQEYHGQEAHSKILPKPNRKRQLTQPQRKSFYPYFFSRMLG